VLATRRASRISRGIDAASVRAAAVARGVASASVRVKLASGGIPSPDTGLDAADHRLDRLALGTRRKCQRHAVLEDGFGEIEYVIN
jgi:hypothetical protein